MRKLFVLSSKIFSCPYCGEPVEMIVDLSEAQQEYIEDCCLLPPDCASPKPFGKLFAYFKRCYTHQVILSERRLWAAISRYFQTTAKYQNRHSRKFN